MLFLGVGLTGLFLTGDVFNFYVFFELAMISAYALAASGGAALIGSALIFAVVNLLGSVLFLVAVATLYRAVGTLEMDAVAARAAQIDPNTAVVDRGALLRRVRGQAGAVPVPLLAARR